MATRSMYDTRDTIAAIATAPGGAARAIIRVSGPNAVAILEPLFRATEVASLADIRRPSVVRGTITAHTTLAALPVDVYLWPGARSYTRQPLAELHTLGSPPLAAALLETICRAGARLARPGEFTLRAFLAGRLDLAQAEAVMGVVDAREKQELDRALARLAGGLARPLTAVRDRLLDLLAELEAGLDFVEEDIQFIGRDQTLTALNDAVSQLDEIAGRWSARGRHDALPRVMLHGMPNVGKSSLFNALAPRARALVSNAPGTTRDYLVATLDLDGIRCQLVDTAGSSSGGDAISRAAEDARADQADTAEIRLLCLDASRPLVAWERQQLAANHDGRQLVLLTKCDFAERAELSCFALKTSTKPPRGLTEVRRAIAQAVGDLLRAAEEASPAAQQCLQSVRTAREATERAQLLVQACQGDELVAGELRVALDALGQVAGAVYTDDLLDRVFSRFCIGK